MGLGLPGEAPYDTLITNAAHQWAVPADLIAAQLEVESSFNPTAHSSTGAQGIAQFEPGTARAYGVNVNDPASSINGEAHYLHDLYGKTGSWDGALQAYSGNTAGYAAKVDALMAAHGGNTVTGAGGTSPATGATPSGSGGAGAVTGWLDSIGVRVGLVVLGGGMLLLGLKKAADA